MLGYLIMQVGVLPPDLFDASATELRETSHVLALLANYSYAKARVLENRQTPDYENYRKSAQQIYDLLPEHLKPSRRI